MLPPATTSAWMRAPRRSARSTDSITSTVAPSRADEAVARRVERPRGGLRALARARRAEALHGREARDDERVDAGLAAAGEHDVGVAAADQLGGLHDGVRPGRAGRDGRHVVAAQVEQRGDRAARDVGQALRQEPRRHALPAALAQDLVLLHHRVEAADRGAEEHAEARRVVDHERGVVGRLPSRRRARAGRCGPCAAPPWRPATATGSKPLTSPATRTGMSLASNCVISAIAGTPGEQRLPGLVGREADRRHAADSRDRDAFHATGDGTRLLSSLSPPDLTVDRSTIFRRMTEEGIDARTRVLLDSLLRAVGPSSYERPAAEIWRKAAGEFADVRGDALGNSFATVNPGRRPARRARRAHRRDRPARQAHRCLRRDLRRRDRLAGTRPSWSASASPC